MGNVIVEDATAEQAGMERSVSTHVPARCRPRRASGSAKAGVLCPALEGVSEGSRASPLCPNPLGQMYAVRMHLT